MSLSERRRAIRAATIAIKHAARQRDQRCRWPARDHDTPGGRCVGNLEATHRRAIGMGGDPLGTRTRREDLLTTCTWIHLQGRRSLEQHGRVWFPLTERGADGPVACFRVISRDWLKRPTCVLVGIA